MSAGFLWQKGVKKTSAEAQHGCSANCGAFRDTYASFNQVSSSAARSYLQPHQLLKQHIYLDKSLSEVDMLYHRV